MSAALRKVFKISGGPAGLAKAIGVSRQNIHQWKRVPATRVADVAKATGIPPAVLRPDLFQAYMEIVAATPLVLPSKPARKRMPRFVRATKDGDVECFVQVALIVDVSRREDGAWIATTMSGSTYVLDEAIAKMLLEG
jgi:DNA-binding transcriptional regulator YdaS (Cro superfamily)